MKFRPIITLLFLLLSVTASAQPISNYQSFWGRATLGNRDKTYFVLRRFVQNNRVKYLMVDPDQLTVSLVPERRVTVKPDSLSGLMNAFPQSAYARAWRKARAHAGTMQDAGITHSIPEQHGVILTIDLCPSEKPLDRVLFQDVVERLSGIEKPVPLAISISGHWLLKHQEELDWLTNLEKQNKIDIVWVNHSFNHYYNKNLPLYLNFMLMKGTNVDQEVLLNEKTMIEHGLNPSIFFRFPGLVSGPKVFERVMDYGLIPIGSDAWLAKGEQADDGNIVLVHANGNEPLGIRKFINLLNQHSPSIKSGEWKLFDLRESVIKEAEI